MFNKYIGGGYFVYSTRYLRDYEGYIDPSDYFRT